MSNNINNILDNIDCDNDLHAIQISFIHGGLMYTSKENTRTLLCNSITNITRLVWTGNNFRKYGLFIRGFDIDDEIYEQYQIIIDSNSYYFMILDISTSIRNYNNNIVGYWFDHKIFDLIKIT